MTESLTAALDWLRHLNLPGKGEEHQHYYDTLRTGIAELIADRDEWRWLATGWRKEAETAEAKLAECQKASAAPGVVDDAMVERAYQAWSHAVIGSFNNREALQAALTATLAACQQDALRYQWLRNESGNNMNAPYVCGVHGAPMGDAGWLTGKHLDAAIDAAITAQEEPP